jgi:hypothetical protein
MCRQPTFPYDASTELPPNRNRLSALTLKSGCDMLFHRRLATNRASTGMSSGLISFDASLIAGLYPGRAPDL